MIQVLKPKTHSHSYSFHFIFMQTKLISKNTKSRHDVKQHMTLHLWPFSFGWWQWWESLPQVFQQASSGLTEPWDAKYFLLSILLESASWDFGASSTFVFHGAALSPAALHDAGERRTRKATWRWKPELVWLHDHPLWSEFVSSQRVSVQGACLKISSRVCPLVTGASHVDKSEPHCAGRLVLESIMDQNLRSFSNSVFVCEFTNFRNLTLLHPAPWERNVLWMESCHHQ